MIGTRIFLSAPRLLLRSTVAPVRRLGTHKPEWMRLAEEEAIAATNARAMSQGTAQDVMMNRLTHELDSERVSNAVKLEERLRQLIAKAGAARGKATDSMGRKVYSAVRKKCLEARQDLITQREAAGMATDAASSVEAAFPIPPPV